MADASQQQVRQKAVSADIKKTWSQVFSIIGSSPVNAPHLQDLAAQPAADRAAYVRNRWGEQALNKVAAYLGRIETLEKELAAACTPP